MAIFSDAGGKGYNEKMFNFGTALGGGDPRGAMEYEAQVKAMETALTAAGIDPSLAPVLARNPAAAQIMIGVQQQKRQDGIDQMALRGPGDGTQASAAPQAPAGRPGGIGGLGGFDTSVNRTLQFEGGLNPRDTNGTPSNFGINQAANPDVNVKSLTQDQAKGLYKQRYWDTIDGDKLQQVNPALAHVAFDTSVIAGPGRAKQMLAESGGDPQKFMDLRENFLNGLLARDPGKYGPYAKAWSNRNAGLRADIGGANLAPVGAVQRAGLPPAGVQVASTDPAAGISPSPSTGQLVAPPAMKPILDAAKVNPNAPVYGFLPPELRANEAAWKKADGSQRTVGEVAAAYQGPKPTAAPAAAPAAAGDSSDDEEDTPATPASPAGQKTAQAAPLQATATDATAIPAGATPTAKPKGGMSAMDELNYWTNQLRTYGSKASDRSIKIIQTNIDNAKFKVQQEKEKEDPVSIREAQWLQTATPAQKEAFFSAKKAGAITIDQRAPSAIEQSYGQKLGDQIASSYGPDALKAAYGMKHQLAQMSEALDRGGNDITTGPYANVVLNGKRLLSNAFNTDISGVQESDVVSKLGFGLATNALRAISSRGTQMEFAKSLENMPGLFLSKAGNKAMIKILQQDQDDTIALAKLAAKPENRNNWPEVAAQYYESHPVLSPFDPKRPLGQADIERLQKEAGIPAAGGGGGTVFDWSPDKGLIGR